MALPSTLSDDDVVALRSFRQGDLLRDLRVVPFLDADGTPVTMEAADGVVLVSQTCDVVLPNRPLVQVATCVQLSEVDAALARDGKRPRFVPLPALGERFFADLELSGTVDKRRLVGLTRTPGVNPEDARVFAQRVARRLNRFAFPDEVTPWLRPLEEVLQSKSLRPTSPEGQGLQCVTQFRVESQGGWVTPPFLLTVVIVVDSGHLPDLGGPVEMPAALVKAKAEGALSTAGEIAQRLLASNDPAERWWLWELLGAAWAERCRPVKGSSEAVRDAVAEVSYEVVSEDDFTLFRVNRSEMLDLDHLSEPTPFDDGGLNDVPSEV